MLPKAGRGVTPRPGAHRMPRRRRALHRAVLEWYGRHRGLRWARQKYACLCGFADAGARPPAGLLVGLWMRALLYEATVGEAGAPPQIYELTHSVDYEGERGCGHFTSRQKGRAYMEAMVRNWSRNDPTPYVPYSEGGREGYTWRDSTLTLAPVELDPVWPEHLEGGPRPTSSAIF